MSYDEKPSIGLSRRSKLVVILIVVLLLASLPILYLLGSCWTGNCL